MKFKLTLNSQLHDVSHCVDIIFGSVGVAEWPLFGKELLTRLTICSLCMLTICNFSYFPF